jgi:hypothetical protein
MLNLLQPIAGLAGQWMSNRAEKAKAKHKLELNVLENKARLALAENEANAEWEMAQLQDKDKVLRWFSYTMFTAPIVITVVNPEWGRRIFENLDYAPSWVVEVWIAMNGAVWGLSSLKNVVPQVVGSIRKK